MLHIGTNVSWPGSGFLIKAEGMNTGELPSAMKSEHLAAEKKEQGTTLYSPGSNDTADMQCKDVASLSTGFKFAGSKHTLRRRIRSIPNTPSDVSLLTACTGCSTS